MVMTCRKIRDLKSGRFKKEAEEENGKFLPFRRKHKHRREHGELPNHGNE